MNITVACIQTYSVPVYIYEALPSRSIRTPAGTPARLGGLTIDQALKHGGYGVLRGWGTPPPPLAEDAKLLNWGLGCCQSTFFFHDLAAGQIWILLFGLDPDCIPPNIILSCLAYCGLGMYNGLL